MKLLFLISKGSLLVKKMIFLCIVCSTLKFVKYLVTFPLRWLTFWHASFPVLFHMILLNNLMKVFVLL